MVGFAAELTFTLLTYGFALSNLARSTVLSLGNYEHDRHITDAERRTKDEKLNFAVNLLGRAGGVYLHIAQVVLPQCVTLNPDSSKRLPDLSRDVVTALSLYVPIRSCGFTNIDFGAVWLLQTLRT